VGMLIVIFVSLNLDFNMLLRTQWRGLCKNHGGH